MSSDPKFSSLIDQLAHQHRVDLDAAFERGREVGRQEAVTAFKARLASLTDMSDLTAGAAIDARADVSKAGEDTGGADTGSADRAPPNSIKPALARLIREQPGLTTMDIRRITGFKPNTIRGTLYALGKEGEIKHSEGRWYSEAQKDEAAGANPEERTPTASNTGSNVEDEGASDQPTHDGQEAVEGKVAHEKIDIFS
ncbi:hypothetical protein [Methylorubrum aminovorans]